MALAESPHFALKTMLGLPRTIPFMSKVLTTNDYECYRKMLYYQILLKYFSLFFQIIEHNNCPTQKDYQRSIIGDKSKMSEDLKWIFNSNYPNDPFASKCSEKMGDVYTQFEGYGVGKLTYGGCSKGRVEVYLDGELISHIKKDTPSKVVEFNFAPYSKLEIKEVDEEAVIEIISLEVGCKGIRVYINHTPCKG